MSIVGRIKELASRKGMTIAEFERKANLANGYIGKVKGSIGSEKIEDILTAFPDLSVEWLMRGEGSMLRPIVIADKSMEMNRERVIDRLDKYMKYKGVNDNRLTKILELGVGTIGKSREPNRDLSRANVERVLSKFLDLDPVWLLTGEGSMLRPIVIADNGSMAAGGDVSHSQTRGADRSLEEKVRALEQENAYLRGQVDLLMKLVTSLTK